MEEKLNAGTSPNRVLCLDELSTPAFQAILGRIDALLARGIGGYVHPSKRWEYPWSLQCADLGSESRILDAGCGGSIFPVYLAAEGHRVTAIDREVPTDFGRAYGVGVNYVETDLRCLPFADNSFDRVFCISVIEHLAREGMEVAMGELNRVLTLGGKLLLTTDYYRDAGAKLNYEGPGGTFPVDWNFFDEASLKSFLAGAEGFFVDGELDLEVDWPNVEQSMIRFHGYPYTSVGVALLKK